MTPEPTPKRLDVCCKICGTFFYAVDASNPDMDTLENIWRQATEECSTLIEIHLVRHAALISNKALPTHTFLSLKPAGGKS